MAVLLSIDAAEVLGLCRLAADDAAAVADADAVIFYEQAGIEEEIDPAAFGVGVTELLRRNVAKRLAAELLAMRRRAEGASGDVQIGSGLGELKVANVPDLATQLRAEAFLALRPYLRQNALLPHPGPRPSVGSSDRSDSVVSRAAQARLYGPSEGERS